MSAEEQMLSATTVTQAKGVAILAVVIIHLAAVLPDSFYFAPSTAWFLLSLQVGLRFCVPLFLALSGYGLAKKYQTQPFTWRDFFVHRLGKLLPLYVLWSVVHLWSFRIYPDWQILPHYPLALTFLAGLADYQLYFVPLIWQLYLVFPWLLRLAPTKLWLAWVASFLIQLASVLLWSYVGLHSDTFSSWPAWLRNDQWQYRLGWNWLSYFIAGVLFAQWQLTALQRHFLYRLSVGLILVSLVTSIGYASSLLQRTHNVIFTTSFLQLPIIALAGSSLLLLFTWPHNHRHIPGVSRFFSVLGRYSYLIFLSHTLIIRLVFSLIEGSVSPLQWGAASMIFVAAWYISLWLMKFPSKKNKVSP